MKREAQQKHLEEKKKIRDERARRARERVNHDPAPSECLTIHRSEFHRQKRLNKKKMAWTLS
jgi:hypothetical protein